MWSWLRYRWRLHKLVREVDRPDYRMSPGTLAILKREARGGA